MNNEFSNDPWALEPENPQHDAEKLDSGKGNQDAKNNMPTETERDRWALENPFANIVVKNITPQTTPKTQRKWTWQAIGHALVIYETRAEIDQFVLGWDEKNDPKVGAQNLLGKIDWALTKFRSKLKGTA